ncbi:MAG: oligosaccharide flippase family protein [Paludibacteraceae bacterium]|nr:oligosaccharide flippase family protein [Paludibacteraceae bacterium]
MGVIAKQSIRGTIVTYIGIAVGVVTTFFVLTRFLTPEEIGLTRVLIDAATLFIGLAQLGTNTSIIRFYPYFSTSQTGTASADPDHGFFFWALTVPFIGFIIFAIIYWACRVPLGAWFGDKSPLFVEYYYFVLPIAFFMLYQVICESTCNVLMNIVVPRAVRELVIRVGLLAIYLLYAFKVLSMDGLVIGLCVNYAVAAMINMIYFFSLKPIRLRPDWTFLRENKPLVRRYFTYTGFLLLSAVTTVLAPTLSSFFVTAKMGLDSTGIFAIATYMAVMVSVPSRSVSAIASPQLARAIKEQNSAECSLLINQVTRNMFLIGGFILLTMWVNIDLIFHILPNGTTFAQAKYVVLILGVSQLVLGTFTICYTALNYSRFYAFSLFISLALTISALILNNYLVPRYGMNGAALSNLLSYGLYIALTITLVAGLCRIRVIEKKWWLILLLLLMLFALNQLWTLYMPSLNIWLDSLLRSLLIIGSGLFIAYKAELSPEINNQIVNRLNRQ